MNGEWWVARGDGGWQGGVARTQLGLGGAKLQVAGGAEGAPSLDGRNIQFASKGEEERSWQLFFMSLLSTQVQIVYLHSVGLTPMKHYIC